ncbi:MAG TPA: hypothetical protein VGX25_16045 [Actinophytocola sp.]|uniref:hypothetical protein n=1 Tax=Actinophytocola sp. TaxID=1872138 RepID=UPI002DDDADC8|nr:hypothetical protein [Actinophytocola sp.]HEV2780897.1 hypothetical protein [Actinophytocola sp.]
MRLIRLGDATSDVGVDVRAALASWGRGDPVVGGIALTGVRPPGCPHPVEAIVVLPRGILVVIGVDLPDPAVRLDAPLSGQWKTDGWPLVRGDGAVNPGVEAMAVADAVRAHLERARVEPLPVGTVIAVGPYVSQVFQPTADLLRGVRILHPEPMTLLGAARELAVYQGRCSVDGARRILAALDAGAELDPAELAAEGFSTAAAPDLTAASTTLIPKVTDPEPVLPPPVRPVRPNGQLRWLPVGAAILVALLLLTGIVVAVVSAGSGATGATNPPAPTAPPTPTGIQVDGVSFDPKGSSRAEDCANHAYGDLQVRLQRSTCSQLIRLRYESTSDNHKAAILVAVLRFPDSASADELRAVADKPGSGAVSDVSVEGTPWPDGGKPFFESAAYASGREGTSVKLVQAVWMDQPSTPDDKTLKGLATRALQLPVED